MDGFWECKFIFLAIPVVISETGAKYHQHIKKSHSKFHNTSKYAHGKLKILNYSKSLRGLDSRPKHQLKLGHLCPSQLVPRFNRANLSLIPAAFAAVIRQKLMDESVLAPNVFRNYYLTKKKKVFWIISSWRSGSTFLASLIENLPGVFYNYEPLDFLGVNSVVTEKDFPAAKKVINDILNCNYTNKALRYFRRKYRDMMLDKRKSFCISPSACLDGNYLTEICKMSPIFAFKTVKMTLRQVEIFINNPEIDLKIIHLVRDPRGVQNSRNHVRWCNRDCSNIKTHCYFLKNDLIYADSLKQTFPGRYFRVRYEDICDDPIKVTKSILKFLQIPYTNHTERFVISHTNGDRVTKKWSTIYRDATKTKSMWRRELPLKIVRYIQKECSFAIKYLDYEWFTSLRSIRNITVNISPGFEFQPQFWNALLHRINHLWKIPTLLPVIISKFKII